MTTPKNRVYLSGPMTGIELDNHPAFHECANRLRSQGYFVINPAEMNDPRPEKTWGDYLKADINLLMHCDKIALMPDWSKSRGAQLELAIALKLGYEVIDAVSLLQMNVDVDLVFRHTAVDFNFDLATYSATQDVEPITP